MRNLLALITAIGLFIFQFDVAIATPNPDTGPGCGLGKTLWEGWKGQKQIAPQLFMASTNMTGSYSFAIASGTSGCSHDGTIFDIQKASFFIETNYASLAEDMARGGGEHLASLVTLLKVPEGYQVELFAMLQERYVLLVNGGEAAPATIRGAVYETIASHPLLARLAMSQ